MLMKDERLLSRYWRVDDVTWAHISLGRPPRGLSKKNFEFPVKHNRFNSQHGKTCRILTWAGGGVDLVDPNDFTIVCSGIDDNFASDVMAGCDRIDGKTAGESCRDKCQCIAALTSRFKAHQCQEMVASKTVCQSSEGNGYLDPRMVATLLETMRRGQGIESVAVSETLSDSNEGHTLGRRLNKSLESVRACSSSILRKQISRAGFRIEGPYERWGAKIGCLFFE